MARYVILEFEENSDAEEFVKQTHQHNEESRKSRLSFQRRVVGVFVKPGKTCVCWDGKWINSGDKNREHGIARGEKFGWWVCTRCNKPRPGGHQLVNQVRLSDCYEGSVYNDFEFGVTALEISGFHTNQIERPKKLKRKRAKNGG